MRPAPSKRPAEYRIVGFFNKNAGRQEQHGRIARLVMKYAKGRARLYTTEHPDQVQQIVQLLMELPAHVRPIYLIGGGDGTQHQGINWLFNEYPELLSLPTNECPLVLTLPLGTENLVWHSTVRPGLGMEQQLERVMVKIQHNHSLDTMFVRTLKVNDRYGFIYGSGLAANFLQQYYASSWRRFGLEFEKKELSWLQWLKLRIFFAKVASLNVAFSGFVRACTFVPAWQRLAPPMNARILLPGREPETLPLAAPTTIMASTITRIGLGFKGMPAAMDHPDRFMLRATEMSLWGFIRNLRRIYKGKDIAKISDALVDQAAIDYGQPTVRMLDGELLELATVDRISLGPAVNIITS